MRSWSVASRPAPGWAGLRENALNVRIYGILAATGVIWSAVYLLWMYQRVFYGKVTHAVNNSLSDLSGFEKWAVWPCAAAALVMGIAPILWLGAIDPAVHAALTPFAQVVSRVVGQ